jgi:hypothetical protein
MLRFFVTYFYHFNQRLMVVFKGVVTNVTFFLSPTFFAMKNRTGWVQTGFLAELL